MACSPGGGCPPGGGFAAAAGDGWLVPGRGCSVECVGRDSGRSSRLKSTSPCSSCCSSSRAELASSDSTAPCICCTEAADSIDVPAPAPSASARSGSSAGSSSLQRRALPAFSTALPLAEDASASSVAAVAGCDVLTAGCTPSGAAIGCAPSDPATEVVVTAPWPPLSIRAIIGGRGMPDGAENMLAVLEGTDYVDPLQPRARMIYDVILCRGR